MARRSPTRSKIASAVLAEGWTVTSNSSASSHSQPVPRRRPREEPPPLAQRAPHLPGLGRLPRTAVAAGDPEGVQAHPVRVQQPGDVVVRGHEQRRRVGEGRVVEERSRVHVPVGGGDGRARPRGRAGGGRRPGFPGRRAAGGRGAGPARSRGAPHGRGRTGGAWPAGAGPVDSRTVRCVGRSSRRRATDGPARALPPRPAPGALPQQVQEHVGGHPAGALDRRRQRGQARVAEVGAEDVVAPDHADGAGHGDVASAQTLQDPDGQDVVERDHGAGAAVQHRRGRAAAPAATVGGKGPSRRTSTPRRRPAPATARHRRWFDQDVGGPAA